MGRKLFKIFIDKRVYKVYIEDVISVFKKTKKIIPRIPKYFSNKNEDIDNIETEY